MEAHLPTLIGDATLAAAFIVYAAVLLPSHRVEALRVWHEQLLASNIPVSSTFHFHEFMQMRMKQVWERKNAKSHALLTESHALLHSRHRHTRTHWHPGTLPPPAPQHMHTLTHVSDCDFVLLAD